MHASEFIVRRENLCKAVSRGVIDKPSFYTGMHKLFKQAQVSQGFPDDCEKADMLVHNFNNPQDKWL